MRRSSCVSDGEGAPRFEVVLDLLQRTAFGLRDTHTGENDVHHTHHTEEQEGNVQPERHLWKSKQTCPLCASACVSVSDECLCECE